MYDKAHGSRRESNKFSGSAEGNIECEFNMWILQKHTEKKWRKYWLLPKDRHVDVMWCRRKASDSPVQRYASNKSSSKSTTSCYYYLIVSPCLQPHLIFNQSSCSSKPSTGQGLTVSYSMVQQGTYALLAPLLLIDTEGYRKWFWLVRWCCFHWKTD